MPGRPALPPARRWRHIEVVSNLLGVVEAEQDPAPEQGGVVLPGEGNVPLLPEPGGVRRVAGDETLLEESRATPGRAELTVAAASLL